MSDLNLFFALTLTSLFVAPAIAAKREFHSSSIFCEKYFQEATSLSSDPARREIEKQILADLAEHAPSQPLSFSLDSEQSHFYLLEPMRPENKHEKEIQTANDYAIYLKEKHGKAFVFMNEHHQRSVPFFDGFIADPESRKALIPVSLKYHSIKANNPDPRALLDSLSKRLLYKDDLIQFVPWRWFGAANSLNHYASKPRKRSAEQYVEQIEHARNLMDIFGIDQKIPLTNPLTKGYALVVDMRDSGYPFEMFQNPQLIADIESMLNDSAISDESLTLVWSASDVVEFGPQKISINQ